jgi:hypothetical protein
LRRFHGLPVAHYAKDEETDVEGADAVELQDVFGAQGIEGKGGLPDVTEDEEPKVYGDNVGARDLVDYGVDPCEVEEEDVSFGD